MADTGAQSIVRAIRQSGFKVTYTADRIDGKAVHTVSAQHPNTEERWEVRGKSFYAAAVALAVRLGFDLEE
jgi:hypothetical protein